MRAAYGGAQGEGGWEDCGEEGEGNRGRGWARAVDGEGYAGREGYCAAGKAIAQQEGDRISYKYTAH